MQRLFGSRAGYFTCISVILCASAVAQAQTASVRPLITQPIDEGQLKTLAGNVHPLAKPANDQGAAPADLPMDRMLLVLNRSAVQESALETFLAAQQSPASPQYHKWLTPQQFGQQFGASDEDLKTITAWLQSHGFAVNNIANGKNVIEFSGNAGQVQETFHTAIHKYVVNGLSYWANSTDPQIPVALTGAVAGVATLHNFGKKAQIISTGKQFQAQVGARPEFTSDGTYALAPGDYATIYNINPLYNAGINGTGVTIAVVGRSSINVSDVTSFRSTFGLPVNNPQIVLNGPGTRDLGGDEEAEAVLDTTWAGAVAPYATVKLVVSATTNTTDGVDLSEQYIIDNNLGDVMTESFGDCEADGYSQGDATFYSSLAQQAAAEGITYAVAAGDSGAEGCDSPTETAATGPISVNILASNPYVVAVGGTEFNENGNYSAYWASTNNDTTQASALSYIPEDVWNESCSVAQCGSTNAALWAGGGGASVFYSKPSWQAGVTGIPNDGARDVPDVALTAAGHDAYLLCLDGSCTPNRRGEIELEGYSGTSAATPSFAAMMALLVQKTGGRQGQVDNVLYTLAASESLSSCNASNTSALPASYCIFHDVTIGNNAVPGETGYGTSSALYQAGVGYDQTAGLGSVNAANLVDAFAGGGTPQLSVNATSLTFSPAIDIGFEETMSLTISNAGTGTLDFSVNISQSATDFSVANTCGTAIVASGSCQLSLKFIPVGAGVRTGTLVIQGTNASLSASVSLTGTGIATANEQFGSTQGSAITSLDFGSQRVLTPGSVQTIPITNSTVQTLDLGTLVIGGTDPEDFALLNTCPSSLAAGSGCDLFIAFSPMLVGSRSASLSVPLVTGGDQVITLSGTGLLTGSFEIMSSLSGKVLDVPNDTGADGTLLQLYALDGSPQQHWQFIPTFGGNYEILNTGTGKVLDVRGASTLAAALVQEWDYLGGANQQWQLVPVDDVHYKIVNVNSGDVLDVVGGSTANGASIQQYTYLGDPQQLWVLMPVTSYNISNGLSGFNLDLAGGDSSDGTLIEQVSPDGARTQQWQLLPTGGGYWAIINTSSGKVLDDTAYSTDDGTLMQEWDYLGGTNQQWQLVPVCSSGTEGCLSAGNLSFKIVNRLSGDVLDDSGYSTTSGTYIQQWSYLGGTNQQWQLTPVVFYNIVNRLSGDVLDVTGGSTSAGTLIQQWASDGFQQQQWQLVSVGGGAYAIINNLTGMALDVQGSSIDAGARIDETAYTGAQSQQWELISLGSGYYEIQNSNSGLVLDVIGLSTLDGAGIQQYNYVGGANQQWQTVPVSN